VLVGYRDVLQRHPGLLRRPLVSRTSIQLMAPAYSQVAATL
jgi:hypothetical protein